MKIFMLGWEFPPFISGGLGTACYGLSRAMSELGHHIIFVLPRPVASSDGTHVQLETPASLSGRAAADGSDPWESYSQEELSNVRFRAIPSTLRAYASPEVRAKRAGAVEGPRPGEAALESFGWPASAGERSILADAGSPVGSHAHYGGDMFAEVHRYARMAL
ncbi:MAG: glycogen/starch synthase, partial [Dehalococcoidia bacterium]